MGHWSLSYNHHAAPTNFYTLHNGADFLSYTPCSHSVAMCHQSLLGIMQLEILCIGHAEWFNPFALPVNKCMFEALLWNKMC